MGPFARLTRRLLSRTKSRGRAPGTARVEPLEGRQLLAAVLVKDISPGEGSSYPYEFTAVGATLYFTAADSRNGWELWRSNGTGKGTQLVADVWPGPASSMPRNLISYHGILLFTAETEVGRELWRSDGTAKGTWLVKDVNPGAESSDIHELVQSGDQVYFAATNARFGRELWKTGGRAKGTVQVSDINPRVDDDGTPLSSSPSGLMDWNGRLFFNAYNYRTADTRSARTDGTTAGTVWSRAKYHPGSDPLFLDRRNRTFLTSDHTSLLKSDGTEAGTVYLKQVQPDRAGDNNRVRIGGTVFFAGKDDGGSGLWKSDGTPAGTSLVKRAWHVHDLTVVGSTLFFSSGSTEALLWRTDGTPSGTVAVKNVDDPYVAGATVQDMTNVNGTVFFAQGSNLRRINRAGTAASVVSGSDVSVDTPLIEVNGILFFRSDAVGKQGSELYRWLAD